MAISYCLEQIPHRLRTVKQKRRPVQPSGTPSEAQLGALCVLGVHDAVLEVELVDVDFVDCERLGRLPAAAGVVRELDRAAARVHALLGADTSCFCPPKF